MSLRLEKAFAAVREAKQEVNDALCADYPVGSTCSWDRGRGTHVGVVLAHGYQDRIKVRNSMIGKAYWIDASDLVR